MRIQIKQLTTTTFIILGLLIIGFQCKKECLGDSRLSVNEPESDYDFIVDMNVSPLQKVYNIGDTITLSFEISDNTLYDSKSQTEVDLGYVKDKMIYFQMFLDIPYIHYPGASSTASDANFYMLTDQPDVITLSPPYFNYVVAGIPCELFSDTFLFDLKIVPLNSGIFTMYQMLPLLPEMLVQFDTSGSCDTIFDNYQTGDISYRFNVADNNPELLEELYIPCEARPVPGLEQKTDEKEFFWIKVE